MNAEKLIAIIRVVFSNNHNIKMQITSQIIRLSEDFTGTTREVVTEFNLRHSKRVSISNKTTAAVNATFN